MEHHKDTQRQSHDHCLKVVQPQYAEQCESVDPSCKKQCPSTLALALYHQPYDEPIHDHEREGGVRD